MNRDSMRHAWMRLFIGFALFIVFVIVVANSGRSEWLFGLFSWIPRYDKVGHFVLMGILTFLAVAALSPRLPSRRWISTSTIMVSLLVLIALEELSQLQIANRTFSGMDYLCSAAGVLVFGIAAHLLGRAPAGEASGKQ